MAESLDKLRKVLDEQIKTYADMAEVIREQQLLVCDGRYSELQKNLEQEISLIARGKYLEQARLELIWEMAQRGEIPSSDLTLPEVINHLGNGSTPSLQNVRTRLRAAVEHLREVNERNAQMLRVSLRAIDNMRTQVFGDNGRAYTPDGVATRHDKVPLVDHQG